MISVAIDAIVERMRTVPGIGRVHPYERVVQDWGKFMSEMYDEALGRTRYWTVSRRGVVVRVQDPAGMSWPVHEVVVKGYEGLRDAAASERDFQDLVDAVLATLWIVRPGDRHPQVAAGYFLEDPIRASSIEPRYLGGESGGCLVHAVEIVLNVEERVADRVPWCRR